MLNKISYLMIPACMCMAMSVAAAETSKQDGPILLSQSEMDYVTAGFGANADVDAAATSPILAFVATTVVAITAASNPDDSTAGGFLAVAGGIAQAVGAYGSTTTSITSSNNLTALGIPSAQVSVHAAWGGVEINGNIIIATGSLITNPF